MRINNRTSRTPFLATTLCLAAAAVTLSVWLPGCSKKPERETVPEMPDTLAESVTFGTFTDKRDGKTYKTVKIGEHWWMAENLNYETDNSLFDASLCYMDSNSYCEKYGRLYEMETAITVCPEGWHVAGAGGEWHKLAVTAGGWDVAGEKLKARSGWNEYQGKNNGNGTDIYGFSALPGGFYHMGSFRGAGNTGIWWDCWPTKRCASVVYIYHNRGWASIGKAPETLYFSVRCVQNDSVIPDTPSVSRDTPAETRDTLPIVCGTLTDTRDGKAYKTVKMPDGKTWMAENLNYLTDSSWCYKNSDSYCDKYGRLYNWDVAMKACPYGYHLPTRQEWDDLALAVGGKRRRRRSGYKYWGGTGEKLKAASGWNNDGNGTDDYIFSALPGGYRTCCYDGVSFYSVGDHGFWWTASENDARNAYHQAMNYAYNIVSDDIRLKNDGLSVRCVQNDN